MPNCPVLAVRYIILSKISQWISNFCLSPSASLDQLLVANQVTLQLSNQKNSTRNSTLHHEWVPGNFCPVQAVACCLPVQHIPAGRPKQPQRYVVLGGPTHPCTIQTCQPSTPTRDMPHHHLVGRFRTQLHRPPLNSGIRGNVTLPQWRSRTTNLHLERWKSKHGSPTYTPKLKQYRPASPSSCLSRLYFTT
jgi:hypothetical protein